MRFWTTLGLVATLSACGGGADYCKQLEKDAEKCGVEGVDEAVQECEAQMLSLIHI